MNLHEYQAKILFSEYGIPVPEGKPAHSVKDALGAAAELGGSSWVVKAQVHAGARGKAGGVRLVNGKDELEDYVKNLLGTVLVTQQSGAEGKPVNCVLVSALSDIADELYLGMLVDRSKRRIAVMASAAGGVDIEEVAATEPEKIFTFAVDPVMGLQQYQCRALAISLGLNGSQGKQLAEILSGLYRLFVDKDLSLVEINPLVITRDGDLEALDAKVSVDDNALYRQAVLESWRDPSQEDARENRAKVYDLNYVALDGDIACMVNGAGHGDHGHHKTARRRTCQFPGRGRRRDDGTRCRSLQTDHVRCQGEGDPGQYLRRHCTLRPDRGRHHQRGQGNRAGYSRSGAAGRHPCR